MFWQRRRRWHHCELDTHRARRAVTAGTALLLLSLVLERLPVGMVYAIWAGCGVAGVAVAGTILFGERIGLPQLAGFACIVAGVGLLSLRPAAG